MLRRKELSHRADSSKLSETPDLRTKFSLYTLSSTYSSPGPPPEIGRTRTYSDMTDRCLNKLPRGSSLAVMLLSLGGLAVLNASNGTDEINDNLLNIEAVHTQPPPRSISRVGDRRDPRGP